MRAKDTFSQACWDLAELLLRARERAVRGGPALRWEVLEAAHGQAPIQKHQRWGEFCLYAPASLQLWREDRSSQLIRRPYNSKGFYGVIQMVNDLAQRDIAIATPVLRARLDELKKCAGKLRAPAPRFIPRTDDIEGLVGSTPTKRAVKGLGDGRDRHLRPAGP